MAEMICAFCLKKNKCSMQTLHSHQFMLDLGKNKKAIKNMTVCV